MSGAYFRCEQPDSTTMIAKNIDFVNEIISDKTEKYIIWVWNNKNFIPALAYGVHTGKPYEIRMIPPDGARMEEWKRNEPDCTHIVYHYIQ